MLFPQETTTSLMAFVREMPDREINSRYEKALAADDGCFINGGAGKKKWHRRGQSRHQNTDRHSPGRCLRERAGYGFHKADLRLRPRARRQMRRPGIDLRSAGEVAEQRASRELPAPVPSRGSISRDRARGHAISSGDSGSGRMGRTMPARPAPARSGWRVWPCTNPSAQERIVSRVLRPIAHPSRRDHPHMNRDHQCQGENRKQPCSHRLSVPGYNQRLGVDSIGL